MVSAAASDGESIVVLSGILSSSTNGEAVNRIDVIFFRHSSSFCFDGIDSEATLPTAIVRQRRDQQRLAGALHGSVHDRQRHMSL